MISNGSLPYIVEWQDNEPTGATGWLVIDSLIHGVASGGLFMHQEATVKEVSELAKTMSWKNGLQEPLIGGAKGGIRFDHLHSEAPNVLKRFLLFHQGYIRNIWSTGADLNTDNMIIHRIICNDLKLPAGFVSVSNMLSHFYGIKNQVNGFLGCLKQPLGSYFNISECATGYSVAMCIDKLCAPSSRILIQGWGNVGRSLGYFLQTKQLGQVVGIIEKDYFISHRDGLDINKLLSIRQRLINSSQFYIDDYLYNVEVQGYQVVRRSPMQKEEIFLLSCLSVPADIFCPCAVRYAITDSVSLALINHTFKEKKGEKPWIICGANNVFVGNALSYLEKAGLALLPEWVANSGNTLLYNEILKNPDSLNVLSEEWLLIIKERLHQFLEESCLESKKRNISLYEACHNLIRKKIQQPALMQKNKGFFQSEDKKLVTEAGVCSI